MSRAPWIEVLAATGIGLAELAAAIALHVWFEELPHDERPVPALDRVPFVLAGMAGLAWVIAVWRVGQRRPPRAASIAALVGQLVLTVAGAGAVIFTDPDFLFGSTHDDTLDLPDGRTAYLYRGGLFCSYEVYLANSDDLIAFRTSSIFRQDCSVRGQLRLEGDRIVVVDERGQPLPDQNDWSALFDWYPH